MELEQDKIEQDQTEQNQIDQKQVSKGKGMLIQFIKFGLVGVSNTVVSYLIYAVVFWTTENYFTANIISWLISVLNAYLWQNIFVFKEDKNGQKRIWWKVLIKTYMAYALTGLFLNNILSWLWIDVIDISRYCSGIIAFLGGLGVTLTNRQFAGYAGPLLNMVVSIPINFFVNKFWAYRQK